MAQYIQEAFNHICDEHKTPTQWYVVLVSLYQAYGGSEEGGWWYTVQSLEAFQEYPTEELASAAVEHIQKFADELSMNARREHGEYCQTTMEWLEQRGLDADYLPEPDGEEEYRVYVTDELPTFNNRRPHYE